ncbi:GNAT family N-acetyltransferase [Paenibacillus marinisediminis]
MNLDAVFAQLPVLESDDVVLKKVEVQDLEDVYVIYDNDRVFTYCGIIPRHNKETVKSIIEHFERDYNKRSKVKWGIFSNREQGRLVGIIEAFDFNQKVNMVTIGYYLAEQYWGQGIASSAVKALVRFLFEDVNVNRIQAEVMPANEASKKVLLKNGLQLEGTLREAAVWSGKGVVDLEIYSALKREYEHSRR